MAAVTYRREMYPAGEAAWVGLIAYVVLYDLVASKKKIPTLSACFATYLARKPHRVVLLMAWMGLSVHLFWDVLRFEEFVATRRALRGTERYEIGEM